MTNASRIAAIAGTCVAAGLCGCAEPERVTLNALPIEVRETLDQATFGGTVAEIERQPRKEGPVIYWAQATVKHQRLDIEIDEDGNLVSKAVVDPNAPERERAEKVGDPDAPPWKWW
jgi:hypothetical protein